MTNVETQWAFARRVGAAAGAAWWSLLIAVGIVIAQFIAYVIISHNECAWQWFASVLAADVETMQRHLMNFMIAIRVVLFVGLLACIFLSLWARRLRKSGEV